MISGLEPGHEGAIDGSPTSDRFHRDHLILSYFLNDYSFQKEKSTQVQLYNIENHSFFFYLVFVSLICTRLLSSLKNYNCCDYRCYENN